MKLTITTGRRTAEYCPEIAITVFTVDIDDAEIDPDDVFHAGNRIESVEYDLARLRTDWQKKVRTELDAAQSPSISVGDTIEICSDHGDYLGGWRCEPFGWTINQASQTERTLP